MATSGTYNFLPVGDDLLTEAWERCGKSPDMLNGAMARSAIRSLQLLQISWTNRGLNLWQTDLQSVTVLAGANSFSCPNATVDVLDLWVVVSGYDRQMAPIGRSEWSGLPNKLTQSSPNVYWVERVNPTPVVHFYPAADQTYTIKYYRMRMPQDMTSLGQNPDAPALWSEALAAELAARLAIKFASDRAQMLRGEADRAFQEAAQENRERVPLILRPQITGR